MGKLCEFLVLNIFMYSFIYAGYFSQKASPLQQHNSNACIGLHNAPIHTTAVAYIRAVGSSFRLGGGLKGRAEGPRKFFNLESLKCHFLDFGEDLTEF